MSPQLASVLPSLPVAFLCISCRCCQPECSQHRRNPRPSRATVSAYWYYYSFLKNCCTANWLHLTEAFTCCVRRCAKARPFSLKTAASASQSLARSLRCQARSTGCLGTRNFSDLKRELGPLGLSFLNASTGDAGSLGTLSVN